MRSLSNMKFLRLSVAALAFAFALATSVVPASALAPKDAVVDCDLNGLLKELAGIKQDGSASTTAAELDLRKQLLTRSMDCNAREATALADTVASLEGNSRVSQGLKKRYEIELDKAAAHATEQGKAAAGLQSVVASKDFAVALKAWRTDAYNPLAWEASQLIILDRNVALANSGEARLEQLQAITADLEDAEGISVVRDDLNQAATLVNDADKKLNDALILLRDKPKESQEAITVAQKVGLDELSQAYRFLLDGNNKLAPLVPAQ